MNVYLKTAVQNVDCEIARLTRIRDDLLNGADTTSVPIAVLTQAPVREIGLPVEAERLGEKKETVKVTKPAREDPPSRKATAGQAARPTCLKNKSQPVKQRRARGGVPSTGAMSAAWLNAGLGLKEPFGAPELVPVMNCEWKQASNAITTWKVKGLIKAVAGERGKYRRLAKFPGTAALNVCGSPSPRPSPPGEGEHGRAPVLKESAVEPTTVKPARGDARPTSPEEKLTPLSAKGIELGRGLPSVFRTADVAEKLSGGLPAAFYWVKQWREKNWIRKEDQDVWRKEATFGE